MRDRGAARVLQPEEGFRYVVVAGVKEPGVLPVIKRRHRMVSFRDEKETDKIIEYVVTQGWFPRDTKWIEVYRVVPMKGEGKPHRRFDLDTLFKETDDEKRAKTG